MAAIVHGGGGAEKVTLDGKKVKEKMSLKTQAVIEPTFDGAKYYNTDSSTSLSYENLIFYKGSFYYIKNVAENDEVGLYKFTEVVGTKVTQKQIVIPKSSLISSSSTSYTYDNIRLAIFNDLLYIVVGNYVNGAKGKIVCFTYDGENFSQSSLVIDLYNSGLNKGYYLAYYSTNWVLAPLKNAEGKEELHFMAKSSYSNIHYVLNNETQSWEPFTDNINDLPVKFMNNYCVINNYLYFFYNSDLSTYYRYNIEQDEFELINNNGEIPKKMSNVINHNGKTYAALQNSLNDYISLNEFNSETQWFDKEIYDFNIGSSVGSWVSVGDEIYYFKSPKATSCGKIILNSFYKDITEEES